MAGDVDRDNLLETEVPDQVWVDEGSDEAARRCIDVNWAVDVLLGEQVVDGFGVLVLASVGRAQDRTDTNCVLIHKVDRLLWVNDIPIVGTVDELLLNIKVPRCLLPAHLNGGVHDDVRLAEVLAGRLALVLPALLHGESREHDGL